MLQIVHVMSGWKTRAGTAKGRIEAGLSRFRAACAIPGARAPFLRDDRGTVAVIFTLVAFVAVALAGGAVDVGRTYSMRTKLQNVLDAATLATASAYLADPNHDINKALAQGRQFFASNMGQDQGASMTSALDAMSQTVAMQAQMNVTTPFLSMVGINSLSLWAATEVATQESLSGGAGAEVEISLMLDTTGSMGQDSGNGTTKMEALKQASKTFVDILLPDVGAPKARIALAPFAPYVHVSDALAQVATGQPLVKDVTTTTTVQCNPETTCEPATCKQYKKGVCQQWNQPVCTTTYSQCDSTSTATAYLSRCMIERTGNAAFDGSGPGDGAYFTPVWKSSESAAKNCTPGQTVVPLTRDKFVLKSTIDSLTASGMTAGHLGTAWAWYMLSPDWSGVFTGESTPKPYATPKLKKIAVLMTDGEYNTYYAKDGSGTAIQGGSPEQAVSLCGGMKLQGIEVFTVGFKLDSQAAIDTLANCATDADHAFLAEDAAQLASVFREIAFRSVPLHVAK
ncbi:MAG: pilus assembly protein [Hyphomicrobiaceae bacterium]